MLPLGASPGVGEEGLAGVADADMALRICCIFIWVTSLGCCCGVPVSGGKGIRGAGAGRKPGQEMRAVFLKKSSGAARTPRGARLMGFPFLQCTAGAFRAGAVCPGGTYVGLSMHYFYGETFDIGICHG